MSCSLGTDVADEWSAVSADDVAELAQSSARRCRKNMGEVAGPMLPRVSAHWVAEGASAESLDRQDDVRIVRVRSRGFVRQIVLQRWPADDAVFAPLWPAVLCLVEWRCGTVMHWHELRPDSDSSLWQQCDFGFGIISTTRRSWRYDLLRCERSRISQDDRLCQRVPFHLRMHCLALDKMQRIGRVARQELGQLLSEIGVCCTT